MTEPLGALAGVFRVPNLRRLEMAYACSRGGPHSRAEHPDCGFRPIVDL
jgi:hypothetical protein